MWSQADTWQVPPLPGPSHGNRNPKLDLSGINLEFLAYKNPFNKINVVTWIVKAWIWWTRKSAVPKFIGAIAILELIAKIVPPKI